jgi:hypothetical protein
MNSNVNARESGNTLAIILTMCNRLPFPKYLSKYTILVVIEEHDVILRKTF